MGLNPAWYQPPPPQTVETVWTFVNASRHLCLRWKAALFFKADLQPARTFGAGTRGVRDVRDEAVIGWKTFDNKHLTQSTAEADVTVASLRLNPDLMGQ